MLSALSLCLSRKLLISLLGLNKPLGKVFLIVGFSLSSLSVLHINFLLYCYVCEKLVMILDLGEVALCRTCPVFQQYTSHSSPGGQEPADLREGSDLCLETQFHRL